MSLKIQSQIRIIRGFLSTRKYSESDKIVGRMLNKKVPFQSNFINESIRRTEIKMQNAKNCIVSLSMYQIEKTFGFGQHQPAGN